MMTTLTLALALGVFPPQTQKLAIENVRYVIAPFGSERKPAKVLPGDVFIMTFEIAGLTSDAEGEILFKMGMEVLDADGKLRYGSPTPQASKGYSSLGGTRIPTYAFTRTDPDLAPGEYTMRVTVVDPTTKASQTASHKFEVVRKELGIVRLLTSVDPSGQHPVPASGVVGEFRWINFSVIGFGKDANKKQPNLSLSMRVLDEQGKPVTEKPIVEEVTELPEAAELSPVQFMLALNRAGKFSVELKASDKVNKKTTTLSFPLTVREPHAVAGDSK